ncbi:MAG: mandelate racemase/muconate lactonizing enzyme family protein [Halobacteriales archaeon]
MTGGVDSTAGGPTVQSVEGYVVKAPQPYRYSGEGEDGASDDDSGEADEGSRKPDDDVTFVPGTDYFFEPDWDQVYSLHVEAVLLKVTTEDGWHGWGEIQAPIVPEVPATLVEELLGPMLLGNEALAIDRHRERMYRSMNVRGHYAGFMIDAIAGLDTALWDLAGRVLDTPASTLLGGRHRERLPAYVSLPGFEPAELADQAEEYVGAGFGGVKAFLGRGVAADVETVATIRDRIGGEPDVLVDGFWSYGVDEAVRLAERLHEFDVGFLEAPLPPEDVEGHARVAERAPLPVAVGEPIRTATEFRRWFEAGAIDVAQPDIVRTGITEARRIADLAATHGVPVAPHVGGSLGIGMAATWHLAAATAEFRVQEHQPTCVAVTNRFLDPELRHEDGDLVVPEGPGLGVEVDEAALSEVVSESFRVSLD